MTKIDISPEDVLNRTLTQIANYVKQPEINKKAILVKKEKGDEHLQKLSKGMFNGNVIPIFQISNVTEEGLPELRKFVYMLQSRIHVSGAFGNEEDPVEFNIDGDFVVTGVGTVVAGVLKSGTVKIGDRLLLGPDKTGLFKKVQVKGIHYKRTVVEIAKAG